MEGLSITPAPAPQTRLMALAAQAERAAAAADRAEEAASFERSDTDGFVSQWAHGVNARKHDLQAQIEEAGGQWLFQRTRLVTLAGEPVDARVVHTRYGTKYRRDETDEWLPYQPARESTLARRGYREVTEAQVGPAKAITWAPAGARGLAGATSVQVIIIRTDATKADGWVPVGPPEVIA